MSRAAAATHSWVAILDKAPGRRLLECTRCGKRSMEHAYQISPITCDEQQARNPPRTERDVLAENERLRAVLERLVGQWDPEGVRSRPDTGDEWREAWWDARVVLGKA